MGAAEGGQAISSPFRVEFKTRSYRRICGTENGVVYESYILHDAAVAADRKSAVVCPVEDPTAANQGVVLHYCVTEKRKGIEAVGHHDARIISGIFHHVVQDSVARSSVESDYRLN